jgi:hypothetical protein
MARIAGITTDKDFKGNIKKVTFDFKKHESDIRPILEKLGIIEEDEFERKCRTGIPIAEARKISIQLIEEKWKTR